MVRSQLVAAFAASVTVAPFMGAQDKPKEEQEVVIPVSALPPEGMCRVWLPDVPERQQPAPTDCLTAIRTRPRDAILLLGEPTRNGKLPPRRATTTAPQTRGGLWDDPLVRNGAMSALNRSDRMVVPRGWVVTAQPGAAPRIAPNPSAAVKAAEPAKAAVVKPPEPPEDPRH